MFRKFFLFLSLVLLFTVQLAIAATPNLTVRLLDHVSSAVLTGHSVHVYEKQLDGSLLWRTQLVTDTSGLTQFDLAGLGTGKVYVLQAKPFGYWVKSDEISTPGSYDFRTGKLQVQMLDGRNGSPYALSDVTLLEKQVDSSLKWISNLRTDSTGLLKLDPAQLGVRPYVLRAASKMDGTQKDSPEYAAKGKYSFTVGGVGLTVRLFDHVSNAFLGNEAVHAYEKQPDGSLVWRSQTITDTAGLTRFDLAGLGAGKIYVFQSKPFGYWVKSDEVNTTGYYGFPAGKLQVQVLDGSNGSPYALSDVTLLEKQIDKSLKWVSNLRTDSTGLLKLDPAQLGVRPYVLRAVSKVDGTQKDSPEYAVKGKYTFSVGGAGLTVRLLDHVSNALLSNQQVHVYEKQLDGSLVWRTQLVTDTSGLTRFDLVGLGTGKVYVLQAKPFGDWVKSDEISTPGSYDFRTGKLQVQVLDGRNGSPYALSDVTLLEKQVDSSLKWISNLRTDSTGLLKLDPAQLGVRPYVLRAASKMDGTQKDSPEYAAKGKYSFTVGGTGLTVRLIDHVSNAFLGNEAVHAYEKQPDGSLVWRSQTITDTAGLTRFDLAGLGAGKTYVFQTQPFGYWVKSDEINAAGYYGFRVGTTLAMLTDGGTTAPLTAKIITAYEKLPTGVLLWAGKGTTDVQGQMKIDLDRLGKGAVYVLQITNPFNDGKNYFSDLLSVKGAFKVALRKGIPNAPDKVPPVISITSPAAGNQVVVGGFQLFGTASDDMAMKTLRVILTQPSGVILDLPANYNADSQTWSLETGILPNPALGALHVLVRATDMGLNVSEVSLDVSLVNDTTPPAVTINSHADGSMVPTGGFLVSGKLANNTLSSSLTAKLSGGGLLTPEERPIEVAAGSGRWAMMVSPVKQFATTPLILTLTAKDRAGNIATKTIQLNPSDVYNQAWHVMQRLGFSGGSVDLAEVVQLGPVNYIQQQLSPNTVDDSAFATRQAGWPDTGLYRATDFLRHALYSRRQLQEVMTWFWDNHFSTYFFKHKMPSFEMNEGAAFRVNALGNFRALLGISAKSPAMLYTLDGVTSYMNNPNENYARELMELHTLGITGGYTQADVEAAARAFTGWTVKADSFYFNAAQHDNAAKLVLGTTFPANGGQADGEKILDMLARHTSTANRICSKLVTLFVADTPVSALVSRCSTTFLAQAAAPDQIAQVLKIILNSPEFLGTTYRGQKFKTPLELAVGSTRNLGGVSTGDDLAVELATMGMDLYTNPSPTGYPETGTRWISSGQLLSRVRFIDRLLAASPASTSTQISLLAEAQALGLQTAEGVTGYLLQASLGPNTTKTQRVLGLNLLTRDGTLPYFSWLPDADIRLRQLEKAIMSLPEYQYQ